MKRRSAWIITLVMLLLLTACGQSPAEPPAETTPPPNGTELPATPTTTPIESGATLTGTTYWTATRWNDGYSEVPLSPQGRWIDLFLWEDGSAQLRDVEQLYLANDEQLYLRWTLEEDGTLWLDRAQTGEAYWTGRLDGERIVLEYFGGELVLEQTPVPKTAGERVCPAQLQGTWLMVSGETEGYEWDALPSFVESLVITYTDYEGLTVDSESRDGGGVLTEAYNDQGIEVLEEPLYSGCDNQVWSARIGPSSPVDENGYPIQEEQYVTLLDENTLLRQRYFSMDGGPGVSYQTFRRMLPQASHWEVAPNELNYSEWVCISYVTSDGETLPCPPGIEDLELYTFADAGYRMTWQDKAGPGTVVVRGTWSVGAGGIVQLVDETEIQTRMAGAVRGNHLQSTPDAYYDLELYLYDGSGILRMGRSAVG